MGLINRILPKKLKPFSRDIGFSIYSCIYKIRSVKKTPHPYPIFILGNQKSGTSAIAALLGKLTSEETAIDLFYSGYNYDLFEKWRNKNISTSQFINQNKLEFSKKIIKEPHLSLFYDELKTYFTNAKFVMIIRHPLDNIRSILDRLDIDGKKKNLNQEDKRKIFHSWNLLFRNNENKNYIESLSKRWNIISSSYLENEENIILVKYEDFLKNKIEVLNKLADNLNLSQRNNISSILDVQYQPKGKRKSLNASEFFSEENIEIINTVCKTNMHLLGY